MSLTGVIPEDVESWVIRVCPVCRGLFEGENSWHKGDCPNRDRMWIPLEIPVVSYGDHMCREQEIALLVETLRQIAVHPTVERNPDGVDQAAATMRLIAREALDWAHVLIKEANR